jgi:hypothetical protein
MLDSAQADRGRFEPLLEIEMAIGDFTSNWSYCDRLSSYAARMVSHNRTDSLLYANLFSSALNELLETVFRVHGPRGKFICSILRQAERDRVELTIPCDAEGARFYREAAGRLLRPDVAERYRNALFARGAIPPEIGMFELAVDYGATLSVETVDDQAIRLTVDLALEERVDV